MNYEKRKGLAKDLIDTFSILNEAKCFFKNISKLFSVYTRKKIH